MDLYLFYHEAGWGKDVDSLYKIKLPSLPISDVKEPLKTAELITPVLELPKDKYPNSMGCVQLGSKLYFLGGQFGSPFAIDTDESRDKFLDITDQVYPGNVYVLDTKADPNHLVLKECPSMTTGKPSTLGFSANGMIYVIGGKVRFSYKFSDDLIKCFERFDPVEGKWRVLDDSPLRRLDRCIAANVIENQHKVLITGWISGCGNRGLVYLVYDFLHDKWDSDPLSIPPFPYPIFHVGGGSLGLYLYAVQSYLPFIPIKLGPLKELDQLDKLSLADLSIVDTPHDWKIQAFHRLLGFNLAIRMHYVGDGHFCYLSAGQSCPGDYAHTPCLHTAKLSVTIFKEVSCATQIEKDKDNGPAPPFQCKLLLTKDYIMNLEFHGGSYLAGSFIVGGLN